MFAFSARRLIQLTSLLFLLCYSVLASATAPSVPSSSNGNYTVTWNTYYMWLEEKAGSGSWTMVTQDAPGTKTFSNKPAGSYSYRAVHFSFYPYMQFYYSAVSTTTVMGIPAIPTGLTSPASDTNGAYTVSWNSSNGATSYNLQRKLNSGGWSTIQTSASTSRAESGLGTGDYSYRVRACSSAGCSSYSSTKTTIVLFAPSTFNVPSSSTNTSIPMSWSSVSNANNYKLYRVEPNAQYIQQLNIWIPLTTLIYNGSGTAYSDTVSNTNKVYTYQIKACKGAYCSGLNQKNTTVVLPPPIPSSINITPSTTNSGSHTVSWSSASGASKYILQQKAGSGGWINKHNASGTSKAFSGLAANNYSYRVQSCRTYSGVTSCSNYSSVKTTIVLYAPSTFNVPSSSTNTSIPMSWNTASNATNYKLYRVEPNAQYIPYPIDVWVPLTTLIYSGSGTAYSDTVANSHKVYTYQIKACNGNYCSTLTQKNTTVVLPPPTPGWASVSPSTSYTGSHTISWGGSSGASKYILQQKKGSGGWVTKHNAAGTSKTLNSLTASSYQYRVQSCRTYSGVTSCSSWKYSSSYSVAKPATPTTFTVPTTDNNGAYTVSWSAATGSTSYTLQRQTNGGGWSTIQSTSALSKAQSGLGNAAYGYRVRACSATGCSNYSTVKTTNVAITPGVPATISVSPSTSYTGSHSISWAASSGSVTNYQLYQSKNGGSYVLKYTGTSTSRTLSNPTTGSYTYRVRAYKTTGSYTSHSGYRTGTAVTVITPSIPGNLSSPSSDGNGAYSVSWNTTTGASSYTLQRRLNSGGWVTIQSTSASSKAESGLGNGAYGYRVRGCSTAGCSSYSSIKTTNVAIAPGVPSSISVNPTTSYTGGHTVSWSAASGSVSGYQLYRKLGSGSYALVYSGGSTSHAASSLAGGSYTYRVRSYKTTGSYSNYSGYRTGSAVTVTSPNVPSTLTVPSNDSDGNYTVSWSSTTGASSYTLQRQSNSASWTTVYTGGSSSRAESSIGGGQHGYRVRACSAVGCSGYSAVKYITVMAPPNLPAAVNPAGNLSSSAEEKGALTGKFSVGEDGSARYSIPIEVPPGINGMAPTLSFNYGSNRGNGVMGLRWALGGQSAISRCKATLVKDATYNGSTATQSAGEIGRYSSQSNLNGLDKMFCLDGQRLVAVNGAYGASGTEYRTESESFTRVISNGTQGGGPQSFTVYKKNGQILQYGNVANARRAADNDSSTVFAWSLTEIADIAGNEIEFNYNLSSGEQTLTSVDYTKNGSTDLNHSVEFDYGSVLRPDILSSYRAGTQINTRQRLQSVRVKAAGNLVRKYIVGYDSSANDPLNVSRVNTVGLCFDEAESDCAQPVNFAWSAIVSDPISTVFHDNFPFGDIGDVNGDGLADVVKVTYAAATGTQVFLGNGDGTFATAQMWATDAEVSNLGPYYTTRIIDMNSDGLNDMVVRTAGVNNVFQGLYVLYSTGTDFGAPQLWLAKTGLDTTAFDCRFSELNGDGLVDCVEYGSANTQIKRYALNKGQGNTVSLSNWSGSLQNLGSTLNYDLNGDDIADLVHSYNGVHQMRFNQGLGNALGAAQSLSSQHGVTGVSYRHYVDVNADGLDDFVYIEPTPYKVKVALNTGKGFLAAETWFMQTSGDGPAFGGTDGYSTTMVDINGDGRFDLLGYGAEGVAVCLSTGVAPSQGGTDTGFLSKWELLDDLSILDTHNLFGDVDGNGLPDFRHTRTGMVGVKAYDFNHMPTHHIEGIDDGYGRHIAIDYRTLAKSNNAYSQTSGQLVNTQKRFVDVDGQLKSVANAQYIVAEYDISNGLGSNTNTHRYQYTNLLRHLSGWGSLGFEKIERETVIGGTVVNKEIFEYSQEANNQYKLAGRLLKQTMQARDGSSLQTVSETVNHWQVKLYNDDTDSSGHNSPHYFPYLDRSTTVYTDLNGAARYTESRYHLDTNVVGSTTCEAGGQTPSVTIGSANAYDNYGGLEQLKTVRCDSLGTYQTSRKRTYHNLVSSSRWVVNQIATELISNIVSGDTDNREVHYSYNSLGQLSQQIVEPNHSSLKLTTSYTYNGFGNVSNTTESWLNVTNGMSGVTSRTVQQTETYASNGERTLVTVNPLNHSSTQIFNATFGLVKTQTDANGVQTQFSYDDLGRVVSETTSKSGEASINTQTAYRLCSSTSSCEGATVPEAQRFIYQKTDGLAPARSYFDLLGREVGSRARGFNGAAVYRFTEYDAQGRVDRVSEPFSTGSMYWTSNTYDNLGRATQVSLPNNSSESTNFNGITVTHTNVLNQSRTRTINALGQDTLVRDNNNVPVAYTYDAFGNLLSTIVNNDNSTSTAITYDDLGRRISLNDPDTGLRQYQVNALGLVYREIDALNQTTNTTYDVLGRTIARHEHGASTSNQWVYDTATDGKGLLTSVSGVDTQGRGYSESYSYTGYGQLEQVTSNIAGSSYTTQYGFDAFNRPDETVYPMGVYAFNSLNQYNAYGYLDEVYDGTSGVQMWQANAADARGQITNADFNNGEFTTTKVFQASTGRVQTIQTEHSVNITLQNQGFTFDALGNLTQRTDGVANTTENFCYDSLNRLTHQMVNNSCSSGSNNQFTYDALGNITSKLNVGNYSYGAGSAGPHAVTSVSGSVASTYNYNANGDMTSGNGRTVAWSPMGKPTQMARGSNTVNIVYGPDRSRIERRDTKSGITSTTTYVQGLFEKVVEPGETSYRFYVGSLAIVTQSTTQGTSTAYPLRDHQESVVGQMDAGGSPVEYLNYNAWGERLQGNAGSLPVDDTFEPVISPRGYTDHEHLDGVRLIHMNGRVYDPELGRFMSADPLIQAPDNTQSFNRYSYVFNNPMSFTDPSGFACINGMGVGLFMCGDSRAINYDDGFGSFITASIGAIGIDLNQYGLLPVDSVTVGGSFLQVTEFDQGESSPIGSTACADSCGSGSTVVNGSSDGNVIADPDEDSGGGSSGGGFLSLLKSAAGKIWNLPNTAIGLSVASVALTVDIIQSSVLTALTFENHFQNIGVNFGNNALQIRVGLTLPGGLGGGLTIGNVILYNNSRPGQNIRSPYSGNRLVNLGRHEGSHTRQGERLGIFYLPAMIRHGIAAPNNRLEIQADNDSLVR